MDVVLNKKKIESETKSLKILHDFPTAPSNPVWDVICRENNLDAQKGETLIKKLEGISFISPTAVENLKHWLNGKGIDKMIPINKLEDNGAIIEQLKKKHYPIIRNGIKKRLLNPSEVTEGEKKFLYGEIKIDTVAKKLLNEGKDTLYYESGMTFENLTDYFYAFGSINLLSEVEVSAIRVGKEDKWLVTIDKWRCKIGDIYNWDIFDKDGNVKPKVTDFLFFEISDGDMRCYQIKNKIGNDYYIKSNYFDMTKHIPMLKFEISKDNNGSNKGSNNDKKR